MDRSELDDWIKKSAEKYITIYDRNEELSIESELHNYKSYYIQIMKDNFELHKNIVDLQEKIEKLTNI